MEDALRKKGQLSKASHCYAIEFLRVLVSHPTLGTNPSTLERNGAQAPQIGESESALVTEVQGFLANKKSPHPRTLQ